MEEAVMMCLFWMSMAKKIKCSSTGKIKSFFSFWVDNWKLKWTQKHLCKIPKYNFHCACPFRSEKHRSGVMGFYYYYHAASPSRSSLQHWSTEIIFCVTKTQHSL